MTLSELKTSALKATTFRGHKMAPWSDYLAVYRCACKVCGMEVSVTPNPAPNDIDIGGPAVALTCKKRPVRYVATTWEVSTYDVWGNARDGFDVNDRYRHGEITLRLKIQLNNVGTANEFESAYPSDSQIRQALGLGRYRIDTDGDDLSIYVNRTNNGYPEGELICTSHASLSPIHVK
jgi:hypothetical protein